MKIKSLVKVIPILFFFALISTMIEQALNEQLNDALRGEISFLVITAGALILLSLVSSLLQIGMFLTFVRRQLNPDIAPKSARILITIWNDFAKEFIRGIGVASMWCFAFLIPGFNRFIDYLFIPFVVFLDPNYQAGQADALKVSSQLGKKIRFKLGMVWLFFSITAPLLSTAFFTDYETFRLTPVPAAAIVLVNTVIEFMFFYTLLKYWLRFKEGESNGLNVQLAGN